MHQVDDTFTSFTRTYRTLNPDPVEGPNTNVLCHPDSNACLDAWRANNQIPLPFLRRKFMNRGCCGTSNG